MMTRRIRTAVDAARTGAASADAALYAAVARSTGSSRLDEALTRLSNAADHSKISLTIAALLAARSGAPRRGALRGLAAIGLTSATANLLGKRLFDRRRPDWDVIGVPLRRRVRMPSSTAFPSGHSASAAAFAVAVGSEVPAAALPLGALAAVVGYSRVHTGVHYPGDVLAGFALGAACAAAVIAVDRRRTGPPAGAGRSGADRAGADRADAGGVGADWAGAGGPSAGEAAPGS